jgi:hypothetical protein
MVTLHPDKIRLLQNYCQTQPLLNFFEEEYWLAEISGKDRDEYCVEEARVAYKDLICFYSGLQLEGKTVLMFAAERGALDLVHDLVCIGNASLDETNEDLDYDSDSEDTGYLVQGKESGYTALMYACELGHTAVAEFLIKSGADCQIKNARNKTALDLAIMARHEKILTLFVESKRESVQPDARLLDAPFFCLYSLTSGAHKKAGKETEMSVLKTASHLGFRNDG